MFTQTVFTVLLLSVTCAHGFHSRHQHDHKSDAHHVKNFNSNPNPNPDGLTGQVSNNSSYQAELSNLMNLVTLLSTSKDWSPFKNVTKKAVKFFGEMNHMQTRLSTAVTSALLGLGVQIINIGECILRFIAGIFLGAFFAILNFLGEFSFDTSGQAFDTAFSAIYGDCPTMTSMRT